jgi:hypothetical protein
MFFLSLAPLLLFPSISSADRQRLPRLPVVKESLAGVYNTNATPHARRLISNPNICCFAFTSTFSEGIKTLYIVVLYTYHGSIECEYERAFASDQLFEVDLEKKLWWGNGNAGGMVYIEIRLFHGISIVDAF